MADQLKIDSAPRWILWVLLGVLFLVIMPLIATLIRPFVESKPEPPPTFTLNRGAGGIVSIPYTSPVVALVVQPTGDCEQCWTDYVARPVDANGHRTPRFWLIYKGYVDLEKKYEDGTSAISMNANPTRTVHDDKQIGGVRFRNRTSAPTTVLLYLN